MKRLIYSVSLTLKVKGILFLMLLCTFTACKEEKHGPILAGVKPESVNGVRVENKPGAAEIYYNMSGDGLLYVLAEYETRQGVKRQAKASVYKSNLLVDGFPAAGEYTVKLYSVGKDEKMSDPVVVKVNPTAPPAITALNTIEIAEDFGGIRIRLKNQTEADLAIGVINLDPSGNWTNSFYYSKMKQIGFSVRGFDPVKRKFGVYIRDRWENITDTVFVELTPLFEEYIDRTNFEQLVLPTDTWKGHATGTLVIKNMFNDIVSTTNCFHTIPLSGIPQHFTFDMKKPVKLSRFRIWHRPSATLIYNAGNLKRFEVWGSNDPNPDGSWDSWIKLGDYESIKPSGLPLGQLSAEDTQAAAEGEEHNIDINAPAVRYLRYKTTQTWSGVDYISIAKLAFWGQLQ